MKVSVNSFAESVLLQNQALLATIITKKLKFQGLIVVTYCTSLSKLAAGSCKAPQAPPQVAEVYLFCTVFVTHLSWPLSTMIVFLFLNYHKQHELSKLFPIQHKTSIGGPGARSGLRAPNVWPPIDRLAHIRELIYEHIYVNSPTKILII